MLLYLLLSAEQYHYLKEQMNFKLLCYCAQVLCIPEQYVKGMWNMLMYIHTYCSVQYISRSSAFRQKTPQGKASDIQYSRAYLLFSSKLRNTFFLIFFLIKFIFSILSRYYFLRSFNDCSRNFQTDHGMSGLVHM